MTSNKICKACILLEGLAKKNDKDKAKKELKIEEEGIVAA